MEKLKRRIEFKLVRHFKKPQDKGLWSEDVYSVLRISTGDWEKDRLRYIKALNTLQEDLNAEEKG